MAGSHQVSIKWDFTQDSKDKYFESPISGNGEDLFLSFQDSCRSFFEICAISPTNVCVCEAFLEKPVLIENATKPFIYLKNLGPSNLTLIGSSLSPQQTSSYYEKKFDDIFTGAACNYLICPNESLFLTLRSSTDGSAYYSIAEYPLGFYYDIDNINEINKSGVDLICCGNSGNPTYTYEQIFNFDDSISICESTELLGYYNNTSFSGNFTHETSSCISRTRSHPSTTGKWSYYLYEEGLVVCPNFLISGEISDWPLAYECPYYTGNLFSPYIQSGKCRISEISGYIKPEKFPESGKFASVLTLSNVNQNQCVFDESGSGVCYFDNLNIDLLRIDDQGYVYFGNTNCFYVSQCEEISGFCFDGNLGVRYDYNSGEFNFTCTGGGLGWGGGTFTFKLKPTNGSYLTGNRQFIFHSDQACLYLQSGKIILAKCDGFRFTGICINTGIYNCVGVYSQGYTVSENINTFYLNNLDLEGRNISWGTDNAYCYFTGDIEFRFCTSYQCCQNNNNGLWNLLNTGENYSFALGMTSSGTEPFFGEIIDFTLRRGFTLTGLSFKTKDKIESGNFSIVSGLNCTGINSFPTLAYYTEYLIPEFGSLRSEYPLRLNQWNFYAVCIQDLCYTYPYCTISLYGDGSGVGIGGAGVTITPFDSICIYRRCNITYESSGLCLSDNIGLCDLYYLTINSIQDQNSEYFCGSLSDITYWVRYFGDNYYNCSIIDFDFKCKNFVGKKHSLNFNYLIDDCANLTLSASGKTKTIEKENKICSLYGGNFHEGIIRICELELHNESGLLTKIKLDENYTGNNFFQCSISGDCSLCLYYNIDNFIQNKCYRYLYCSVTPDFSSKQCFVCNFFGINNILCLNNQCEISGNLLYELTGNFDSCIFVDLNLQNDFSLKTVSGLFWKKSSMFLPPVNCLPYCYCFQVANVNNLANAANGNWTEDQTGLAIEQYVNYTEIVSIDNQDYLNCCSEVYDFLIDVSESRSKISDIQCKNEDSIGEPFIAVFDLSEESFFYSGLEYKYNPVCSVIFRCNEYSIPNVCMNMQVFSSGNSVSFDFPIRALNQDKIKIIAESQTIELVSKTKIDLDYSGFQMQFSCYSSNYNAFKIPKISSGSISPNLCAQIDPCSKVENCINFYIDPYSNFKDDLTYGMNNFLFFIASQLNSGLVYCCNFSGFDYATSDYNFLMVDLKNEFYDCGYSVPSGSEKFLINSIISFEDLNSEQPLLYKSISGNGYNYIVPVPTGLVFSDCTNSSTYGVICNECFINKTLKDITTGFQYSGGSTGYFYTGSGALTDEILSGFFTGNGSGFYSGFLLNSCFCYVNNSYVLNINNQEIDQTESGKTICLMKKYSFSGVQPVILYSNYPLQEVRNNLVLTDLSNYCSSKFNCSGVFYYTYDITQNKKENLKFLSPDLTYIQNVNWTDDRGDCNYLCFLCSDNSFGQIQKNAASIKFDVTGLVQNNRYFYSMDEAESICFIIREDL